MELYPSSIGEGLVLRLTNYYEYDLVLKKPKENYRSSNTRM